jgi:hypothetical protein
MIQRAPLQTLEDPYLDLSGVALDPVRDEIVLVTGQRAASILVYDRLADTSPGASLLEPKRMISGPNTKLGAPGIYVDSGTGEIYSVDTTHGAYANSGNRMLTFSHTARGNVAPDRELLIPHRGFAVAADEEAQEFYITVQTPPAVLVYSKKAKGNEAPVRILEGQHTQLTDVHGIALDTKNQLMYVANRSAASNLEEGWSGIPIVEEGGLRTWDPKIDFGDDQVPGTGKFIPPSITVYSKKASGDTPPLRVIQGPKTQLGWPAFSALDTERQELYVANSWEHSILVFRATDNGDVAPIRMLKGTRTGLNNPYGLVLDEKHGELIVANYGNHSATVYSRTAEGNTPPIRTIRTAPEGTVVPIFQHSGSVAYDSKRERILVQSCIAQPQMTALAKGVSSDLQQPPPAQTLGGEATKQGRAAHDMRYDALHDEIVFTNPDSQAVLTYRGGASGEEPPLRIIQGPSVGKIGDNVEVDPVHDEIFVAVDDKISVFPRTAKGDVAPIRVIEGPDTRLGETRSSFVSVDPKNNLIVVAGRGRMLIFNRSDTGNVKPKAVIEHGFLTGIQHLRVYPPKDRIVTVLGGKPAGVGQDDMTAIAVWNIHDKGNVSPLLILTDPSGAVENARRFDFDVKSKEIIVAGGLTIRRYYLPEIF